MTNYYPSLKLKMNTYFLLVQRHIFEVKLQLNRLSTVAIVFFSSKVISLKGADPPPVPCCSLPPKMLLRVCVVPRGLCHATTIVQRCARTTIIECILTEPGDQVGLQQFADVASGLQWKTAVREKVGVAESYGKSKHAAVRVYHVHELGVRRCQVTHFTRPHV